MHTFSLCNGRLGRLEQQPRALVVAVVALEAEHCGHLVVIHCIVDVKVGFLATSLDLAVLVALCEGADVPADIDPQWKRIERPTRASAFGAAALEKLGECLGARR